MTRLVTHAVSAALFVCLLAALAVGLLVAPAFEIASRSEKLGRRRPS